MSRTNNFIHGAILLSGVFLGFLLREKLKTQDQGALVMERKSSIQRSIGKKGLRGNQLSTVKQILAEGAGAGLKLAPEENALLKHALFHLNPADYPQALEALLDKNLEDYRFREIARILFLEWGKKDPIEALEGIGKVPYERQMFMRGSVYLGWSLADAEAAFEYAEGHTPFKEGQNSDGLMRLWGDFAQERPEEALERLLNLAERDMMLESEVIGRIGSIRPGLALDWVTAHREGEEFQETLSTLITSWGRVEHEQALRYVKDLPEELQSSRIFKELGSGFRGSSQEALAMVEDLPEGYQSDFLGGVISNLAANHPLQAIEVMEELPGGWTKKTSYRELAETWGTLDPVAAGEWLVALPRSSHRDFAILGFSGALREHDLPLAAAWAGDIDDEQRRSSQLSAILSQWRSIDEPAARDWMAQQAPEIVSEGKEEATFE